ncbi:hypothetical protein RZS08_07760 [Arthrospira platensis SPKY1]|nr:hypothetical protein [Arthrospira platensis SPKY1]
MAEPDRECAPEGAQPLAEEVGRRDARSVSALACALGPPLPEVQVEEVSSPQLGRLDSVVDDCTWHPAHAAAVLEQPAVDLGVLAAVVVSALAAEAGVEVADAIEHFAAKGEIATEDRCGPLVQPARLAMIELTEETEQFVLEPGGALSILELDFDAAAECVRMVL